MRRACCCGAAEKALTIANLARLELGIFLDLPPVASKRLDKSHKRQVFMRRKFKRRHFIFGAVAVGAIGGLRTTQIFGKTVKYKPLAPFNPDILFGTTGSIWGEAGVGATRVYSTEQAIKHISLVGLQGIEPYAPGVEEYRSNPK